jgi:hypothetical protein
MWSARVATTKFLIIFEVDMTCAIVSLKDPGWPSTIHDVVKFVLPTSDIFLWNGKHKVYTLAHGTNDLMAAMRDLYEQALDKAMRDEGGRWLGDADAYHRGIPGISFGSQKALSIMIEVLSHEEEEDNTSPENTLFE